MYTLGSAQYPDVDA